MQDTTHVITLASCPKGWEWRLIDGEGRIAKTGLADQQETAMAAAWREARLLSDVSLADYPNIILGED